MVELRGLEPLTPTLPGKSTTPEREGFGHFHRVVEAVEAATVVRVGVRIVVRPSDRQAAG